MSGYIFLGIVLGYIFMMGWTARMFRGKVSPRLAAFSGLFWPLTLALGAVCIPLYIAATIIKNEWW